MNCNTGELIRLSKDPEEYERQKEEFKKLMFEEVPKELQREAIKELGKKDRVFVNMSNNTPLVKWANQHKTGRNEPCPCGSGKKYKHCCIGKELPKSIKAIPDK